MKFIVATVCTADHFQWYIPMYLWTWFNAYPERIERFEIHLMGKLEKPIWELLNDRRFRAPFLIRDDQHKEFPANVSVSNTLRWVVLEPTQKPGEQLPVLITDIDTLHFPGNPSIFEYMDGIRKVLGGPFAGYHGPWLWPKRPEVTEDGWKGDYERVAGGFFMVWPGWWEATAAARERQRARLKEGITGTYRESDEVTLCQIIKESGFKPPQSKHFPLELRGIHLGDFKPSMSHRFGSDKKMASKVHPRSLREYVRLKDQAFWSTIVGTCRQEPKIDVVFQNLHQYIERVGYADEE